MNCDHCGEDIEPESGYVEIDTTVWEDESNGHSVKEVFHNFCPRTSKDKTKGNVNEI